MNNIDLAIIVLMGLSCIVGFIRGFTREVLGLFTWVGAGLSTYVLVPMVGGIMRGHIANPMIADTITAVALFIILLIVFSIISGLISNNVRQSNLGGVDRSLGFGFGILRGAIGLCLIEIGLSTVVARTNQSASIQEARFTPLVRRGADSLIGYMPEKVLEMIATQTEKATDKAKTAVQEQVTQQVQNMIQTPSLPLQQPTALPQNQPPMAKLPEDQEKTVESLAQLKPQAPDHKIIDGDYNKHQKRDMDRLVQATQ